jgi:phosphatidylinositol 4-kinase B
MKAPRATCEGYLTLRTSPSSPPPMLRRYCFLVGTSFQYYSTQEDAYHMLRLKGAVDVLGVQEWDGKGNMHIYQNGFLFATAQSKVFYAYADTAMEKEKWIRAIQMTVETTMPRLTRVASNALGMVESTSPSGAVAVETDGPTCKCPHCQPSESVPAPVQAMVLYKCHNCDTYFCEKFTGNKVPLPQRSFYYAKRVCDKCYEAQMYLNYLRAISERLKAGICLYPKPLNEATPIELLMPMRPLHTGAAQIAIDELKKGNITAEECEAIIRADRRFLDHTVDHPELPLDLKILGLHREFRARNFGVYRAVILLHRHLDSDPLLFKPIVERLLHFSYTRINQVEFYWPQIVHAYLSVPMFDFEKIFWLDELVMSVCSRSIHLALLLRWQLQGALEDSFNPNAPPNMQDKYARVVRLMVEIEQEVVGTDLSAILTMEPPAVPSDKKSRLPTPSPEQLAQIYKLSEEIANYRAKAVASAADQSSGTIPYTAPLSPSTNHATQGGDNESDARFRDFSRFQQHLLTPKEDFGALFHPDDHEIRPSAIEEEDNADKQPTSIFSGPARRMSATEKSVLAQHFADECDFVEQITDIAEALRFVPAIADRKKLLPGYLEKIRLPPMAYVPLVKATDPFERIVRIPTKEGTAFSTKARVPIMLIFEVIRGNMFGDNDPVLSPVSPHRTSDCAGSEAIASSGVEYVEDEEVGRLLRHQNSNGLAAAAAAAAEADDDESVRPKSTPESRLDRSLSNVDPRATRSMSLPAPETPADLHGVVETPKTLDTTRLDMVTELTDTPESTDSEARQLDMDMSVTNIPQEAIQRETERRKDLEAAFGESWNSKRKRLQQASPYGHLPGWDIVSMIGKSNDDLRQEVFTLQLIQKFIEIFKAANVPVWLRCYRIIATSSSTGLIETLANAMSLDGLKKRDGYVSLLHHFEKSYGPVDSPRFKQARRKYIESMAGYSIVCYLLQIKDRHNGNIMLDNEGHIIHIDYGFLLGIAPGGSFSIETAPFKLTAEMVDTMGGPESEGFKEYVKLCTRGFLACQKHCDEICDLVDIMSRQSSYPCFAGKDIGYILLRLRSRFKLTLSKQEAVAHVLSLIRKSHGNYSTRQYDNFQRMTNGILP